MSAPASYVLGNAVYEYERLMLQGRLLRGYTDKYFRAAGITQGMRVLDLGSGVGDVALVAADIVGPAGRVLGLDRDPNALERARQRTVEQGCSSWVSFHAANLEDFSGNEKFDAVVGRFILMYQPDAAAALRQLTKFLKPGGIVAFHEMDFTNANSTWPPCEPYDQLYSVLSETFVRSGAKPDFGRRLGKTYLDAGLPFPSIVAESIVGGSAGSYIFPWVASTIISISPRMKEMGLTLPAGLEADETLAGKLEEAVTAAGSQITGPIQYGAWTRLPLA